MHESQVDTTGLGGVQTTPGPNTSAKCRSTNGSLIVIQTGVYTTFSKEESILLQKHHERHGRHIVILFKVSGSGVNVALLKTMATLQRQGRS